MRFAVCELLKWSQQVSSASVGGVDESVTKEEAGPLDEFLDHVLVARQ